MSGIPVQKRRQLAATLGLFSVLFIAVGAVAATGPSNGLLKAFIVVVLLVAVLLALLAWGVARTVRVDLADQRLDAAIGAAVEAGGSSMCGCGHEHDPDELHVTDDPCEKDGAGRECTHSCDTCVLARMRPVAQAEGAATDRAADAAQAADGVAPAADLAGLRPSPTRTRAQRLGAS
jgi:hypothetical protein